MMFPNKIEWNNAWLLARLPYHGRRRFLLLLLCCFAVSAGTIILSITGISHLLGDPLQPVHFFDDFQGTAILLLVSLFCMHAVLYHTRRERLSAFPQTRGSRFLAGQIQLCALLLLCTLLYASAILLQYGVLSAAVRRYPQLHFVHAMGVNAFLCGVAVSLVYAWLFCCAASLLLALLRKCPLITLLALASVLAYAIIAEEYFLTQEIPLLSPMYTFLFREDSVPLFFLKSVPLCFLLCYMAYFIACRTPAEESHSWKKGLTRALITALVLMLIPRLLFHDANENTMPAQDTTPAVEHRTVLDAANLAQGSELVLFAQQMEGDSVVFPDLPQMPRFRVRYHAQELREFRGEKIQIITPALNSS